MPLLEDFALEGETGHLGTSILSFSVDYSRACKPFRIAFKAIAYQAMLLGVGVSAHTHAHTHRDTEGMWLQKPHSTQERTHFRKRALLAPVLCEASSRTEVRGTFVL